MWLRVNSQRTTAGEYSGGLREAGLGARAETRVPHAVVLDSPRDVDDLPGFAEGLVSVQGLGAQCVAFPLGLAAGQRVLDACAAPGGKTALIAEREPQLATVVAVDIDPQRLERVRENLKRGNLRAEIVNGDAGTPSPRGGGVSVDRLLVDAACSALGG